MKNDKKGFTLIEILVVILIIGILAAIALPQYQMAKDKADFAQFQSMVASLRDAYNDYVLIHGEGTNSFDDLAVTLPTGFVHSYSLADIYKCSSNEKMFCCISKSFDESSKKAVSLIDCGKKDLSLIYSETLYNFSGQSSNGHHCYALPQNNRANKLCSSMSGSSFTSNIWTPLGADNTYNGYRINR